MFCEINLIFTLISSVTWRFCSDSAKQKPPCSTERPTPINLIDLIDQM